MIPPFLLSDQSISQPPPTKSSSPSNTTTTTKSNNQQGKKKKPSSSKSSTKSKSSSKSNNGSNNKQEEERKHEEKLDKQLSELGLKRKNIAKDGSCLFRACADVLFHTQSYHARLRRTVVDFMVKNKNHYRDFIFEMPFEMYCQTMRKPNTWAGHLELDAIAQCFRCDIVIYSIRGIEAEQKFYNNPNLVGCVKSRGGVVGSKQGEIPTIMLCFLHGNHYDVLYPDQFYEVAGLCQDIFYQSVLNKGMDIDVEPAPHAHIYKGYRNVEYDVYIGELRQMAAVDQELAKQMELERKQKEEEEAQKKQKELEALQEPYEVKTVVSSGKVIKAEDQYGSWSKALTTKEQKTDSTSTPQDEVGDDMMMPPTSGADLTIKVEEQLPAADANNLNPTTVVATQVSYSDLAKTTETKANIPKLSPPGVWSELSEGGEVIPGTFFIPIKSPLDPNKYEPAFSFKEFCKMQSRDKKRNIGMIIDLSSADKPLYDYDDTPNTVTVVKLGSSTDTGMPTEKQIQQFISIVDEFRSTHPESYIVIHCMYGVNRTGVFACEYLIRKVGCNVGQALKAFAIGRGLAIYHPFFIDELFRRNNQTASSMFQTFSYPAFPAFVKEAYLRNVQSQNMLEKRGLEFSQFNFESMRSFDDLTQFDSIVLPRACLPEKKKPNNPKSNKSKKQQQKKNKGNKTTR